MRQENEYLKRQREILKKTKLPRHRQDQQLAAKIKSSFHEGRQIYGALWIQMALRNQGLRVGKNRIRRLMKQNNLRGHPKEKIPTLHDSEPTQTARG